MNMEPLREFVSLETRKEGTGRRTEGGQAKARRAGGDHHPQFIEEGVPSMTVEVDGVKRTLSIYPDVYASPLNGRERGR